jgi:hypothetical protein
MRLIKTIALLLGIVSACPAYAKSDISSGSYFLRACNSFLDTKVSVNDWHSYEEAGECFGSARMLIFLGRKGAGICSPEGVTVSQVARVIVKYLNDHPEKLHEDYRVLSVEALQKVWHYSKN